ncbi:YcxB family protein [Clostridium intestinale]|uniref:YcxB-like protein n=1 Tax=Clostridium intestinale DSM 6191 TaxID=1121320 RepID=A0A1M5XYW7_9CLOT|nr:YcxB family protein [Clostridium intestinale]SHI05001.1 YcxB-like protein [Clostridium intestinale DSM 6191]
MNIKFKIEYKDFLNFYTSATYKTERFNKIVKYTWLFILLIVAFVILVSSENKFRGIAFIIAILVSIFIRFFMKVFYKNMIIAGLNRKESTYMFKAMEVTLSEKEGLYVKNFREKRLIYFNVIRALYMVDNYLIIIFGNNDYIYIPKAAFKDTPQEYDFINLLKEKTNKTVSNLYPQFLLYK